MDKKGLLDMVTRKIRLDEIYKDGYCEVMADKLDFPVKYIYKIDNCFYDMVYIEKDKGVVVPFCSFSEIEGIRHSIKCNRQLYIKYFDNKNYKQVFHLLALDYKQFGMVLFDILEDIIPDEQKQECLEIATNGTKADDWLDKLYGGV